MVCNAARRTNERPGSPCIVTEATTYETFTVHPGGLQTATTKDGRVIGLIEVMRRADGVFIMNFPSLLMIDFDTPSPRHIDDRSVVGTTLDELKRRLLSSDSAFVKYGLPPGATWRIHKTKGGYHAFRMDIAVRPSRLMADLIEEIVCDPGYASLVRNTRTWPIRISPKTTDEKSLYDVVCETFGGTTVCDECLLQILCFQAHAKTHTEFVVNELKLGMSNDVSK